LQSIGVPGNARTTSSSSVRHARIDAVLLSHIGGQWCFALIMRHIDHATKAIHRMAAAKEALIQQLERARALHLGRAASFQLAISLDALARWQSERLVQTYADLGRDPRYVKAIDFFRSDLYGPGDFSGRDADLARVVPVMARLLPEAVVSTIARSMELSVLSHELDRALHEKLGGRALNVVSYCDAYRACENRPARERQIALMGDVGRALDGYVGRPFIRSALAAMRRPAHVAGLGHLQDFLERGFTAFADMRGAAQFLAVVNARETQLMNAIVAGDSAPFPEPVSS
jgi:hypothetical protein